MARRRNNDDQILNLAKFVGILVMLGVLFPPIRQKLVAVGTIAAIIVIGVIALVILIVLVKKTVRREQSESLQVESFEVRTTAPTTQMRRVGAAVPQKEDPPLVDKIRAVDWFQFEKVIEVLYRKLGYQVTRRGGANADGGIDLILEKDGRRTAVQCKQWKTWNVGVKVIREFLGALTDAGIQHGIFITLCGFTVDAKQLADKHGIEIVNEPDLVKLLEKSDARFDPLLIEALNDSRKFCPKCEREMVLRMATKGAGVGQQFWGCSAYPRCRYTMPI